MRQLTILLRFRMLAFSFALVALSGCMDKPGSDDTEASDTSDVSGADTEVDASADTSDGADGSTESDTTADSDEAGDGSSASDTAGDTDDVADGSEDAGSDADGSGDAGSDADGSGDAGSDADGSGSPVLPTLALENVICAEGNSGVRTCNIPVRFSSPNEEPVSFRLTVSSESTATPGTDFNFAGGRFDVAPFVDIEVGVEIVGDLDIEGDETVVIDVEIISGAVPAEINGRRGIVLIPNDDAPPPPTLVSLPGQRFRHTATTMPDGSIFVAGGDNGAGEQDTTLIIAADGTTISSGPVLPEPRARHNATLLTDGRVLLTGGLTTGTSVSLASTVLCDLTANICSPGPTMLTGRLLHSAVKLADGRVLLAGGVPDYGAGTTLASAEIFVPRTSSSVPDLITPAENDMPSPRDSMAAALLPSGEVVLAGGAGVGTGEQLIRYQPGVGFSANPTNLAFPRYSATATTMPDGRVLIAGGYLQNTTEWISLPSDPTAPLVVTPGPSLNESRYYHIAILLADGSLLLSGGYLWDTTTSTLSARSTVEILDPGAAAWRFGTPLSEPRGEHGAALLPLSGRVAHIGGSNAPGISATMDLLTP